MTAHEPKSTGKKILIILGHPARKRKSYCEALALAYKEKALHAGHLVELVKIADLSFDPILHEGYKEEQAVEPDIAAARDKMHWAEHWVIVYPLWQFGMPALLKGFFERTLVKGFAYDFTAERSVRLLNGKTARVIQSMGMPSFFYRWYYFEHGEKALKDVLALCGIKCRRTYCGLAESCADKERNRQLAQVGKLGKLAA